MCILNVFVITEVILGRLKLKVRKLRYAIILATGSVIYTRK